MDEGVKLEEYLSGGVDRIVRGILAASLKNPRAAVFMAKYAANAKRAREKRKTAESAGEHIPPFLIASVTDECNLRCKGCYAWANRVCAEGGTGGLMTDEDWDSVFAQAEELGVEFILLAGGEPFIRTEVLSRAGRHPGVLFPVFTNGTMIDGAKLRLLEKNRNLLPVVSVEGGRRATDRRRGEGVYQRVERAMERLRDSGVLFGASVTVTKPNMAEVLSEAFARGLADMGAKAVIYVEYVPVDEGTKELAPDAETRTELARRLDELRRCVPELLFISFPGDERASGGCLAAGRGFFHINPRGRAEPCPFSPYSDTSVLEVSLREALRSPLFLSLRSDGALREEHDGGCVLFERRDRVEALLSERTP